MRSSWAILVAFAVIIACAFWYDATVLSARPTAALPADPR
jgi:hypothetical protein